MHALLGRAIGREGLVGSFLARGVLRAVVCDLLLEFLLEDLANRALLRRNRAEIDSDAFENGFGRLGLLREVRFRYERVAIRDLPKPIRVRGQDETKPTK